MLSRLFKLILTALTKFTHNFVIISGILVIFSATVWGAFYVGGVRIDSFVNIFATGKISGGEAQRAGADPRVTILPRMFIQGTGTLTNGTTSTVTDYIDATPVGEWTGTDADIASSTNAVYYKEGAESLKVTITADAIATDNVLNPLGGGDENWTDNESVGMWIYSTVALSAGDLTFRIVDDIAGNTDTNIPAVPANVWTWVEVDISAVANTSKDVITDIAIVYAVDIGAVELYFDFMAKWDASDEVALSQDILQDGVMGVISCPIASASDMAWTSKTEYTNYFINYAAAGNGNIVVMSDESLNCFIISYVYE